MAANAKKILITTERRETFILRQFGGMALQGFCPGCGDEVGWLSLDAAVFRSGLNWQRLIEMSQRGEFHSVQAPSGHLLICERSMALENGSD